MSASFSANFGISNIEIKEIMVGGERWGDDGGLLQVFLRKSLHQYNKSVVMCVNEVWFYARRETAAGRLEPREVLTR